MVQSLGCAGLVGRTGRKALVSVAAAALMLGAASLSAKADVTTVVFGGAGFSDNSYSGFAGGVWAPNGFNSNGFFLRAFGLILDFDFSTTLSPNGKADGDVYSGNISGGYRFVLDGLSFSPYVGFDFDERDISPSVADTGRAGDDVGVIVGARIESNFDSGPFSWSVDGNWASTNDKYFVQGDLGYRVGMVTFGPQAAVLGNKGYDAQRVGGFAKVDLGGGIFLTGSVGYQFSSNNVFRGGSDDDGVYGNIIAGIVF